MEQLAYNNVTSCSLIQISLFRLKLFWIGDYYNFDENILADGNIDQLRKRNNSTNSENNTLRFGQYGAGNDFRFTLILKKPNEYVFKFRNFILSEGVFTRNKKEVMLYNTSLQLDNILVCFEPDNGEDKNNL